MHSAPLLTTGVALVRRLSGTALLLLLVALGACADSTGPGDRWVGEYRLVSVGARPVPGAVREDAPGPDAYRLVFDSARIVIRGDFTGEVTFAQSITSNPLPPEEPFLWSSTGWRLPSTLRFSRDTISMTYGSEFMTTVPTRTDVIIAAPGELRLRSFAGYSDLGEFLFVRQ